MGFEDSYESACRVPGFGPIIRAISNREQAHVVARLLEKRIAGAVRDGEFTGLGDIARAFAAAHSTQRDGRQLRVRIAGADHPSVLRHFLEECDHILGPRPWAPDSKHLVELARDALRRDSRSQTEPEAQAVCIDLVQKALIAWALRRIEPAFHQMMRKWNATPSARDAVVRELTSQIRLEQVAREVLNGTPERARAPRSRGIPAADFAVRSLL